MGNYCAQKKNKNICIGSKNTKYRKIKTIKFSNCYYPIINDFEPFTYHFSPQKTFNPSKNNNKKSKVSINILKINQNTVKTANLRNKYLKLNQI